MAEAATLVIDDRDLEPRESWFRSWFPYLRWVPSTPKLLRDAEEKLLSFVATKSDGWYVDSSFTTDEMSPVITDADATDASRDATSTSTTPSLKHCKIWTRRFRSANMMKDVETPLVMIHGMGAGLALFCLNFDSLVKERTVYAIDLPGFGRSSRCSFSSDPIAAEEQYIVALEKWRQNIGIKKMILLGHSFGGFLSASYALKHPDRVQHLILADPWGLPEKPADIVQRHNFSLLARVIFKVAVNFNPLAALRASGPYGSSMIRRLRGDIIGLFDQLFPQDLSEEDRFALSSEVIASYLFHLNGHNPTGESAFHTMMSGFGWAKRPIFPRMADLNKDVPLTVIYGERSWVSTISQKQFEEVRGDLAFTQVHVIPGANHHVYAFSDSFNEIVRNAAASRSNKK